jgi:SNF2 family DNA or RNA helicase
VLVDRLIRAGEKVVIACCYDDELYALRDYYGDACVIYNGKISLKAKDAAIDRFYNDETCKVFIGNNVSASVGITLINSCNLVWNSFSYSSVDVKQFQDRICRIGQKRECHIWFQMFNETQNEHVWDIILKKELISDNLIKKEGDK